MTVWADIFRIVAFVLYFLILGQTLAIVVAYFRAREHIRKTDPRPHGGLLPNHVILLGVSLIGADTEAVIQNYQRIGGHFTTYGFVNPVLFLVTNYGLYLVMRFEWRRIAVNDAQLQL